VSEGDVMPLRTAGGHLPGAVNVSRGNLQLAGCQLALTGRTWAAPEGAVGSRVRAAMVATGRWLANCGWPDRNSPSQRGLRADLATAQAPTPKFASPARLLGCASPPPPRVVVAPSLTALRTRALTPAVSCAMAS
jgi:hypothetical protein